MPGGSRSKALLQRPGNVSCEKTALSPIEPNATIPHPIGLSGCELARANTGVGYANRLNVRVRPFSSHSMHLTLHML